MSAALPDDKCKAPPADPSAYASLATRFPIEKTKPRTRGYPGLPLSCWRAASLRQSNSTPQSICRLPRCKPILWSSAIIPIAVCFRPLQFGLICSRTVLCEDEEPFESSKTKAASAAFLFRPGPKLTFVASVDGGKPKFHQTLTRIRTFLHL